MLNNENWLDYAISLYDTNNNLDYEIYDDLAHIQNLKKYLNFYLRGNYKFIRQIINTIIILNNNFTVSGAFNLIVFKLDKIYYPMIKTCYCYLRLIDINCEDIEIKSKYKEIMQNTEIDNNFLKLLRINIPNKKIV